MLSLVANVGNPLLGLTAVIYIPENIPLNPVLLVPLSQLLSPCIFKYGLFCVM